MTHDELLLQLQYDRPERYAQYTNALYAVVKLHKPEALDEKTNVCLACSPDLLHIYPCKTIEAIEKELS